MLAIYLVWNITSYLNGMLTLSKTTLQQNKSDLIACHCIIQYYVREAAKIVFLQSIKGGGGGKGLSNKEKIFFFLKFYFFLNLYPFFWPLSRGGGAKGLSGLSASLIRSKQFCVCVVFASMTYRRCIRSSVRSRHWCSASPLTLAYRAPQSK